MRSMAMSMLTSLIMCTCRRTVQQEQMQVLRGQRRSAKAQQAAAQQTSLKLQEERQPQRQQRQQKQQKQPQSGTLMQRGWLQRQCQQWCLRLQQT
jgi:hypothetical protein